MPVALGRGGIRANKREGDGGTPRAPFGPGNCGGAPTATRGRAHSCPSAPSGPKTPGAKIRKAAITTSRYGSSAGCGGDRLTRDDHLYDFIVEIDHNSSPAHRRPRQRGIPASGAREFRADRRMRVDDEIGHAAAAAAAGSRDQNRDWMSAICGISKTMLDKNQIAAASRTLQDHWRAGTKLASLDACTASSRSRAKATRSRRHRKVLGRNICSAGKSQPPARPGKSTSMSTARWPDASCPRR